MPNTTEDLSAIHNDIAEINRKIKSIDTAFLRDDLSGIDYSGHRIEHLERKNTTKIISEYKISTTKVILGIIVTFIIGLLSSGIITKITELVSK